MAGIDRDFGEFADAQSSRLLGLAYTLTGDPHDAWDLVQETLVRVGVRWRRLRDEDPSAYARTVMVRLNIDRLRRLRREIPVIQVHDASMPVVEVGHVDQWLVDALADLSPRQRTALALRFVEDLDIAHIAERMGCSVGTAKSHLSRGMTKLRERTDSARNARSKEVTSP
jgi:RNA polymerase sigma-70 factor (sigma-E family)